MRKVSNTELRQAAKTRRSARDTFLVFFTPYSDCLGYAERLELPQRHRQCTSAGVETPQEEMQTMKNLIANKYATLSLISIMLTAIISASHHVFRDGLGQIVLFLIIILLPYVLIRWFTHTGTKWAVAIYGLYNILIIAGLGVVDGFLDHTLKALGVQHTTILPGGEAEVVKTVFSLWSPAAGNSFYECTCMLTVIRSGSATVNLYQVVRPLPPSTKKPANEQLPGPAEAG